MKKILAIALLGITLTGCAGMEFVAVDYHSGHNYGPHIYPTGHINYSIGYYSGSHYNGYRVYGDHGHRYYYAPPHYAHHRYYSAPPVVVVQHRHVHVSACYVRGGHSYTPPRPRHTPVPTRAPRAVPRQREDRTDRNRTRQREVVRTPTPRARVAPRREDRPDRGKRQNRERQNEK